MSIQILKVRVCRHILTNGRRCKSPARSVSAFCFHHQKLRPSRPRTINVPVAPALVRFAPNALSDRASIQHALGLLLNAISSGEIDLKRAGKMLAILNRASLDLSRPATSTS